MSHLALYVGMLHRAEQTMIDSLETVGDTHAAETDVPHTCRTLADLSREHLRLLTPVAARYGEQLAGSDIEEPERLHAEGLAGGRQGGVGLLRDLRDLYALPP